MRKRKYFSAGFTLIEVLLSVAILAIGLTSVLRAYSTSAVAMERFFHKLDSVHLLKTAMARIDEEVLTDGSIPVGVSSGEFDVVATEGLDTERTGAWKWRREIKKMIIPARQDTAASHSEDGNTIPELKKEPGFYLVDLKIAVANSMDPLKEVSLETYRSVAKRAGD